MAWRMPVLAPNEPYASDERLLTALCVWRESRGCPFEAKLGVAWTIRNRCTQAPREGFKPTAAGNILKPWAFSSFMAGDPNATKYPLESDPSWIDSLRAVDATEPDPTGSGVFYYSAPLAAPPKAWGIVGEHIAHSADIGGLHFFRLL